MSDSPWSATTPDSPSATRWPQITPTRVDRVALAEIPGPPGAAPSPPLLVPGPLNDRLWHLAFNRIDKLNEQLVAGREDVFFGWEFDAAAKKLPKDVIDYYVGLLSNPDSLRGSFGFYRALDMTVAQNAQRKEPIDHAHSRDRRSGKLRRPRRGRDETRR